MILNKCEVIASDQDQARANIHDAFMLELMSTNGGEIVAPHGFGEPAYAYIGSNVEEVPSARPALPAEKMAGFVAISH
ncbi:MAG: hypothetical protein JWP13_537 [Candidatus Saccharibacteria bacterium]|nr:hypothetical protein [Candidatus Saccharibacteria bacterium]